jgi:hypothetical protein
MYKVNKEVRLSQDNFLRIGNKERYIEKFAGVDWQRYPIAD